MQVPQLPSSLEQMADRYGYTNLYGAGPHCAQHERRGTFVSEHWVLSLLIGIAVAVAIPTYRGNSKTNHAKNDQVASFCPIISDAGAIAAYPCDGTKIPLNSGREWRCLGSQMYVWRTLTDYADCIKAGS